MTLQTKEPTYDFNEHPLYNIMIDVMETLCNGSYSEDCVRLILAYRSFTTSPIQQAHNLLLETYPQFNLERKYDGFKMMYHQIEGLETIGWEYKKKIERVFGSPYEIDGSNRFEEDISPFSNIDFIRESIIKSITYEKDLEYYYFIMIHRRLAMNNSKNGTFFKCRKETLGDGGVIDEFWCGVTSCIEGVLDDDSLRGEGYDENISNIYGEHFQYAEGRNYTNWFPIICMKTFYEAQLHDGFFKDINSLCFSKYGEKVVWDKKPIAYDSYGCVKNEYIIQVLSYSTFYQFITATDCIQLRQDNPSNVYLNFTFNNDVLAGILAGIIRFWKKTIIDGCKTACNEFVIDRMVDKMKRIIYLYSWCNVFKQTNHLKNSDIVSRYICNSLEDSYKDILENKTKLYAEVNNLMWRVRFVNGNRFVEGYEGFTNSVWGELKVNNVYSWNLSRVYGVNTTIARILHRSFIGCKKFLLFTEEHYDYKPTIKNGYRSDFLRNNNGITKQYCKYILDRGGIEYKKGSSINILMGLIRTKGLVLEQKKWKNNFKQVIRVINKKFGKIKLNNL